MKLRLIVDVVDLAPGRSASSGSANAAPGTTVVLGPSLGTSTRVWDGVVACLRDSLQDAAPDALPLRVIAFDLPGHGRSPKASAPFDLTDLAIGVLHAIEGVQHGPVHYAGISLGGAIGIELAVARPASVRAMTLFCTSARIGSAEGWAERAENVRAEGTASLRAKTPGRWFAPEFVAAEPARVERFLSELDEVDDESYALCAEALARFDRRADLARITCRTTAVGASDDVVSTPADLERLARAIPGARFVTIHGSSHLAPAENPAEAARIILDEFAKGKTESAH